VPVAPEFRDDPSDPAGWVPPEVSPGVELPGEQLLLDGNVEAEGYEYFALGAFSVSHDGRLLAWSTDTEGDERYTLRFRSLDPEVAAPDEEIAGIAPGATWSRDGRYVVYVTVDDAWRPDTVWRHRLGPPATTTRRCSTSPTSPTGSGSARPAARSTCRSGSGPRSPPRCGASSRRTRRASSG